MLAAGPSPKCSPRECMVVPEGCRANCQDEVWPIVSIYGTANLLNTSVLPSNLKDQSVMWRDYFAGSINETYVVPWRTKRVLSRSHGIWGPAIVSVATPEFLTFLASEEQKAPFARKFDAGAQFNGNMSLVQAFDQYIHEAA
eukprot:UN3153